MNDREIRSLRGPKPAVDPWKAHGWVVDEERRPGGRVESALTVFLAGAECPFTCVFCDLWRYTIDGPTPAGAIPKQVADTLAATSPAPTRPDRIKLYNASNFFDRRAVPSTDLPRVAQLCAGFGGVTVESHAATVGRATLEFSCSLSEAGGGTRLEIAMGLETIHPDASKRLNKRLDLTRFDDAARMLAENEIAVRVFVLLGAPYVPREESIEWTVRSAEFASRRGAALVSIIPVRGGNGAMEWLAGRGEFAPPTLRELELALDRCLGWPNTVVTADLWDASLLPACSLCRDTRIERMCRINVTGRDEPSVECSACGGTPGALELSAP